MAKLVFKKDRSVILENLVVADTFIKRFLGLLNKPCPKIGEGLVFFDCSSIHMFFMRYPIGVLFMDTNGNALKVIDTLKPWRIASCMGASVTIETAPGFWAKSKIKVGDQLEILRDL